jgi:hypothetical protein
LHSGTKSGGGLKDDDGGQWHGKHVETPARLGANNEV